MKKKVVIVLLASCLIVLPKNIFAQLEFKTKTIFYRDGTTGMAFWDSLANVSAMYLHGDPEANTRDGIITLWDNPDLLGAAFYLSGTGEFFYTDDGRTWVKDPNQLSFEGLGFKFVVFASGQIGMSVSLAPVFSDTLHLYYHLPWRRTTYGVSFRKWMGFEFSYRYAFDEQGNTIAEEISHDGLGWKSIMGK